MVPLIIGLSVNGWNVCRALRSKGLRPLVIDDQPESIFWKCSDIELLYSKHLSGPELIALLNSLDKERQYLLISALEETISSLNAARDKLGPHIVLEFPAPETVRMLLDKRQFYEAATSLGCRIYPMYFLNDDWTLAATAGPVPFPCILKKNTKLYVTGVAKAYRIDNAAALKQVLQAISVCPGIRPSDLVLQQWVPGGDSEVVFCMQYYDRDSKPVMSFTGKKIRQWRPETGGTSSAVAMDAPDALAETTRFFKAVRMHGICSMEFKRSAADGLLYMIEPTVCRADYQEGTAVSNGFNLPYAMYCSATGKPVEPPQPKRRPVTWVHIGDDYKSALVYRARGQLSRYDWLKSLRGPKAFAIFTMQDTGPFRELLRRKIRNRLARLLGTMNRAPRKPRMIDPAASQANGER